MKNLYLTCFLILLTHGIYAQQKGILDSLKVTTIIIPENYTSIPVPPDSVPKFLSRVIDSVKNNHGTFGKLKFDVKADLSENGVHESLWMWLIDYENNHFVGLLVQPSSQFKDMNPGQIVTFKQEAIMEVIIKDPTTEVQTNYSIGRSN